MSNTEGKWQKRGTYFVFGLFSLCGVLWVGDMWFDLFAIMPLGKIVITLVVLGLIVGGFLMIRRDLQDDDKMRKDGYMD
jgi:hypothetical protein